jgi:hypothetical protein
VKRFAFPLETALAWRFRQLELEEAQLQALFGEREAFLSAKRRLSHDLAKEETLLTGAIMNAEQLAALDRFRRHVAARNLRLDAAISECEQRIEAQRARVNEARRQHELLDRLRGKALAEWTAAEAREQEQLAAELYLARCVRDR